MSITTLAELERVEPGTFVRISGHPNQTYERTRAGFVRDGVTIPMDSFTGAVSSGLLEIFDGTLSPGDRFQNPNYTVRQIMVIGPAERGEWHVLNYRSGQNFYSLGTASGAALLEYPRITDPPNPALLVAVAAELHRVHTGAVGGLNTNQVHDLHAYASTVASQGGDFDALLEQVGIGRGADHTITITIKGTSTMTPDQKQASSLLGEGFTATRVGQQVEVAWKKKVVVTRYGIGCTCESITEADITPHLPTGTSNFEWTVKH